MQGNSQTYTPIDMDDIIVQESIEKIIEAISGMNLTIHIDDDLSGLQHYLNASGAYPNPSFDPDVSDLRADAFWLRAEDQNGRIVASHAERIFSCNDFIQDIVATDELWFARGAREHAENWRTEIFAPPARISGKVGYAGAMFVQKEHRGSGLSLLLPYLSRSLCLRNYKTQWHTGLVHLNIASSPVPTLCYGYPRTSMIFLGRCPRTTGEFKEVHLCWMSRVESIKKIKELPNHDRYPLNIPSAHLMLMPNAQQERENLTI